MTTQQKIFLRFASPFFGLAFLEAAIVGILMFRYDSGSYSANPNQLSTIVASSIIGSIFLLGRILGAIALPLFGYWFSTQKVNLRLIILIAGAGILGAFVFAFIPLISITSPWLIFYLTVVIALYFVCFSAYFIIYIAFIPKLALTREDNVSLTTTVALFSLSGAALGVVIAPYLLDKLGFFALACTMATITIPFLFFPPKMLKQEILPSKKTSSTQQSFFKAILFSFSNKDFSIYLTSVVCARISITMLMNCAVYIAVALLHKNTSFSSIISLSIIAGTVFGLLFFKKLALKKGEKWLWISSKLALAFILFFLAFAQNLSPSIAIWLLLFFCLGPCITVFFILPNFLLAEIAQNKPDIATSEVYFGVRGFFVDASIGAGSFFVGQILMLGKSAENPIGIQASLFIAALFALLSAMTFKSYNRL